MITHIHHIIPKHMGGTDDPDNLIELTVEEHAEAHRKLYEEHGNEYDLIAWRMLSGQIDVAEATRQAQVEAANRRWTDEARKAQSEKMLADNHMRGRTISDKQKKIISEANKIPKPWLSELYKGNPVNVMKGSSNPKARSVIVDGVEYETITAAAEAHGVSGVTARRRLSVDTFPNWSYK